MAGFSGSWGGGRLRMLVAGAAAAIAAASLVLHAHPTFDPWSWLVWGREVTTLDLDTTGGPSWKPLPVAITTVLALAGDAAPHLWLFLTRFAWLISAALAASIATRLTPRDVAAAIPGGAYPVGAAAGLAVVLLDDSFTPWLRQGATGLSEPILLALLLGAFDARIRGREGLVLGLTFAAALIRPEAWVLLAYLVWERRGGARPGGQPARAHRSRWAPALLLPLLLLAWLVPDLLGSGDALTGAERAREGTGFPVLEALEVAGRLMLMPIAVIWVGVIAVIARFRDSPAGSRTTELLLASAVWTATTAAMAALGYAGLPRFLIPAAVGACILGVIGLAALTTTRSGQAGTTAAGVVAFVLAAAAIGQVGWRAADLVGDVRGVGDRAEVEDDIVAEARGIEARAPRCPVLYMERFLYGPAVAWDLDRPISEVRPVPSDAPAECLVTAPGDPGDGEPG